MNWTFLGNHGHVIVQIAKNPDVKISDLADLVGVTERHARAIVNELRDAGYIEVSKVGRRNSYRVMASMPLRHAAESEKTLGELLSIFAVVSS
jgi:MarR-like DNA-binding transcriptional regulator SgrR of sgrS sRNA